MVLTVSIVNSDCLSGLADKWSLQPTTPNSAPAMRLSVAHTRPLLCVSAQGTVDARRPPNTCNILQSYN